MSQDDTCQCIPASWSSETILLLTIKEIQELQIRVLLRTVRVVLQFVIIHRVERRQVQFSELVEIKELGVGEERQFSVEVERVLFLLLLHSLVIGRWNRVQVIEVLGEVGGATAIEFGHGDSVEAGIASRIRTLQNGLMVTSFPLTARRFEMDNDVHTNGRMRGLPEK